MEQWNSAGVLYSNILEFLHACGPKGLLNFSAKNTAPPEILFMKRHRQKFHVDIVIYFLLFDDLVLSILILFLKWIYVILKPVIKLYYLVKPPNVITELIRKNF